jgi:hypothetical protein
MKRVEAQGHDAAQDDDGRLLKDDTIDRLEVAHILPHFLTKAGPDSRLVSNVCSCDGKTTLADTK